MTPQLAPVCLICRQITGHAPVPGGVLTDDLVLTFHVPPDTDQLAYLGHLLVVPKRHASDFAALTPVEAAAIGAAIGSYSRRLKAKGATRVYVATIGHRVDHLHVHLIPRWPEIPDDVPWHSIDEWHGARPGDATTIADFVATLSARDGR